MKRLSIFKPIIVLFVAVMCVFSASRASAEIDEATLAHLQDVAREKLETVLNIEAPEIIKCHIIDDSYIYITFANMVEMRVFIDTEEASFIPSALEQLIIDVRHEVASNLDIDISEASVHHVSPIYSDERFRQLGISAGELELEYKVNTDPGAISYELTGIEHAVTGLDILQRAKDRYQYVANAPAPAIASWSQGDFVGDLRLVFGNGAIMNVGIMEGISSFDPPWLEQAILDVREEIAQNLNINLSEVSLDLASVEPPFEPYIIRVSSTSRCPVLVARDLSALGY